MRRVVVTGMGIISPIGNSLDEVTDTVATAMGGREAGLVFEGDRRFDVVVRLPDAVRDDLDAVGLELAL